MTYKDFIRSRQFKAFKKHKLAQFGLFILIFFILVGIFADFIAPHEPNKMNLRMAYKSPSSEHILGTDRIGRDYFSRIVHGTRVSLAVGLGGIFIATIIGIFLGSLSGYLGGKLDIILLKLSELIICFPSIVLILMIVTIVGQSLTNIIIIFGLLEWVGLYRLVRSLFLSLREKEFVEALEAFGVNKFSIMFNHMLPNAIAPIVVWMTLTLAGMILSEAGLSFLGMGVPLQVPSWGNLLNGSKDIRVLEEMPWLWIPPGIIITLAVLGINFLGDGLRDAFNPRQEN